MTLSCAVETPATSRSLLVRYRTRIALLLFLVMLPALVLQEPRWANHHWHGFLLDTLGYALILGGVALRLWSTLYIGGRKNTTLQTTGPYSLVRHPLYLGSFLIGLGLVALAQSLLVLALVLGYFVLQYAVTVAFEERLLRHYFPAEHAAYCHRVPAVLPNFRSYVSAPVDTITYSALRAEARHALVYLAFIPLMHGIATLHALHLLPRLPFL